MPFLREDLDALRRDPGLIDLIERRFEPWLRRWFRAEVRGLERIPEGAALLVGNHSGGFLTPDTFLFGTALYRARGVDALPYGLAHETPLKLPWIGDLISRLGAVRAGHEAAHRLFAAGHKVLVYPGGDIDAFRSSLDRDKVIFGERRGYLRLALREGVPLVPIVSAGSHDGWIVLSDGRWLATMLDTRRLLRTEVLPITLSIPWGLSIGAPPGYFPLRARILIETLPPMTFDRRGEEAAGDTAYVEHCHTLVHGAMQSALTRLAGEIRKR
ncbi:MAG: lysophospholipid acyltransferase family protein [Minicystis sp.]